MGLRDLKDAITGKAAADRKQARAENDTLQQKLAALLAEKEQLENKIKTLKREEEAAKKAHTEAEKESYSKGWNEGASETKDKLTQEGWEKRTKYNELSKQQQMAKLLSHLVYDEILPRDVKKVLLTLQELMKSNSVDVMRPASSYKRDCLLEQFLQSFYDKDLSAEKVSFFQKVFKIILNAKGKNGTKADITSHLPNGRNPLIGYFGAMPSLHPFLETAINSAAFDGAKFDGDHFWRVYKYTSTYGAKDDAVQIHKWLLQNGDRSGEERFTGAYNEAYDQMLSSGKLKEKPSMSDKLQERLNKMSTRELLKAVKEGVISGDIQVEAPKKTAPKKRVVSRKGPRGE